MPRLQARALSGIRAIAAEHDDFLVDLWGVVHEGEHVFEGVLSALEGLHIAGKRVLFLTNSSRRSDLIEEQLVTRLGIPRELFLGVVSSGDVTREAIRSRDPAVFAGLVDVRCLHVGDASFVPWLFERELGLTFVDEVESASLIVATGTTRDEEALRRLRERLRPAAARGVPLVCTNPDRIVPTASGLVIGPGEVAAIYALLGAPAFLYGKPHPPIYDAARRRLGAAGPGTSSRRLVAIGDLLQTDIDGARTNGLPSVLVVATGVHGRQLRIERADDSSLQWLFDTERIAPDMVIDRFAW